MASLNVTWDELLGSDIYRNASENRKAEMQNRWLDTLMGRIGKDVIADESGHIADRIIRETSLSQAQIYDAMKRAGYTPSKEEAAAMNNTEREVARQNGPSEEASKIYTALAVGGAKILQGGNNAVGYTLAGMDWLKEKIGLSIGESVVKEQAFANARYMANLAKDQEQAANIDSDVVGHLQRKEWGKALESEVYGIATELPNLAMQAVMGGAGAITNALRSVTYGSVYMGLSAAGDKYNELRDDDSLSDGQKMAIATLNGTFEALFEHLSTEQLLKKAAGGEGAVFRKFLEQPSMKTAIVQSLKTMGAAGTAEAQEEFATEIAQELTDKLGRAGSFKEAKEILKSIDWKDMLLKATNAGVVAFGSGAFMGSGEVANDLSSIRKYVANSRADFNRIMGMNPEDRMPAKYATQEQRRNALKKLFDEGEPITFGEPTEQDRLGALQFAMEAMESRGVDENTEGKSGELYRDLKNRYEEFIKEQEAIEQEGAGPDMVQPSVEDSATATETPPLPTATERVELETVPDTPTAPPEDNTAAAERDAEQERAKSELQERYAKFKEKHPAIEDEAFRKANGKRVGQLQDAIENGNKAQFDVLVDYLRKSAEDWNKRKKKSPKDLVKPKETETTTVSSTDVEDTVETKPEETAEKAGDTYSVDFTPGETVIKDDKGRDAKVVVLESDDELDRRRDFADRSEHVTGHWAVVDASALDVSRQMDNVSQNRDMSSSASRAKVMEIANGMRKNPTQILDERTVDHGAPTVVVVKDKDGNNRIQVHFGNHRAQATIDVYYGGGEGAKSLRQTVEHYAKRHGMDISGIQRPVLVFIQDKAQTKEQMQRGTQKGNHTGTRTMTPAQNAQSDALLLAQHPEILRKYVPGGNLATDNFEFLQAFMDITDTRNAGLLDEKNRPTREADDRVTRALFAYFLRDELPERQERMLKSVIDNAGDNNIVGLVKGIMSNVASLSRITLEHPEYSLDKEIVNALDNYLEYKRAKSRGDFSTVDAWFNQDSFAFDEGGKKQDVSPVEQDLVRIFDKIKSAWGIRDFFGKYAAKVREETGSLSMFEDMGALDKAGVVHALVNDAFEPDEGGTSALADVESEGESAPSVEGAREAEDEPSAKTDGKNPVLDHKLKDIDSAVKIAKKLFPQFEFVVYKSVDDMPPELRAALPHEDDVPEAANEKGRIIHIFADKMPSDPKQIRQRIMSHEIVGHSGLKQLMGERYNSMLDSIAKGHLEDIVPIARLYDYDMRNDDDRREATEEYLARIADMENPPSWFQQLVSKIRATLRVMFNIDWSDNDIKAVISEASKNLQKVQGAQGIRFALSDSTSTLEDDHHSLMAINQSFNEELQKQKDGLLPKGHIYHLGHPGKILLSTNIPYLPIELTASRLAEKATAAHHPFDVLDVADLPLALDNPIAVFSYGDSNKAQNIIVELSKNGKNFVVGLTLRSVYRGIEVNDIRGLYPKDTAEWLNWIQQDKSLYLDKQKIQAIIDQQRRNLAEVAYLNLDNIENIIANYQNPTAPVEKTSIHPTKEKTSMDGENPDIRFSLVTDAKTKEEFQDRDKCIETYRSAMLGDDGKLYPPMATRGGEGMELGQVYRSDEHPEKINSKGKFPLGSDMRDSGVRGSVEAAYNPYFHSQPGVLNDQFAVAYDKSRMVTVKCRVLKSDLESGYWAEGAKNPVGYAEWDTSGPVTRQLRGRGGRTVILSRYIMPVEIVPDSEVARMIKEQLGDDDVTIPWNVVPPRLRDELAKLGVKIGSEEEFRKAQAKTSEAKRNARRNIFPTKGDVKWSIVALPSGKNVAFLDNKEELKKINLNDKQSIQDYLEKCIDENPEGFLRLNANERIRLGHDLPKEYTRGNYTEMLEHRKGRLAKAKNKLATDLPEAIAVSDERTSELAKHKQRENGVYYKRPITFALPSGHQSDIKVYTANLLSYTIGGNEYLYDVVDIKDAPLDVADETVKAIANLPARIAENGTFRELPVDGADKTNILPTKEIASRESEESQSGVDWSLSAEQPTALGPETDIDRAEERRMLQAAAVTPIEKMRAMRLPLLLELAKRLKGGVKAVDRIARVAGGKAEGVFRPNTRQIEVLRRLAGPQLLGKPLMVPADKVDEQRKLWTDFWTAKGVPVSELEITETPVGSEVRMEAIRHDRTLAKFREVAGHEIGHLIDYNAGDTTSKGNVLGTVGGMLKRYLAHVIGETPTTQIDKDELVRRRKALRAEAEANVEAVSSKPKADDKSAMQSWRRAVSDEYRRLFEAECDKNGWFRAAVVREEMADLTAWWSGEFDPKSNYGKYRMKPAELFAETMSVLLNAPDELMKRSPETWRMIQNYQSNRADFHKAWEQLMGLMNDETAYAKTLLEIQRQGFDAGETEALKSVKNNPETFGVSEMLKAARRQFVDRFGDVSSASKQLVMKGQMVFDDTPLAAVTTAQHASMKDYYMKMANRLWQPLLKMGIIEKDVGLFMQNKRIANDPSLNDTDKGILNPNGLTADDANAVLKELRNQLGDAKWDALENWHSEFWKLRRETIIKMMEESGAYSKELIEHSKKNEWYAYRKIISTLHGNDGASFGGSSAKIYGLKGTVDSAANPLAWTYENDLRIMGGILWNTARLRTVDMVKQFFPNMVAKPKVSGQLTNGRLVYADAPEGFQRMYVQRNGKVEQWDVANSFADGFRNVVDEDMRQLMEVFSKVTNAFRAGWTTYSPTFFVNNVIRDYLSSYQNMTWNGSPGMLKWAKFWALGMKEAFRDEFGRNFGWTSDVIDEMERLGMFQSAQKGHGDVIYGGTENARVMDRYNILPTKNMKQILLESLKNPLEAYKTFMQHLVGATERGAKAGGYMAMKSLTPSMSESEMRYHVVKHIGSPDFATRGVKTYITNTLFVFSNAAVQGWSSTLETAKANPGSYALRWMATTGLANVVTWAMESGALLAALKLMGLGDDDGLVKFLEWMKKLYGKITHYNRFNYMCLPIGETEDGQAVYIRTPYAENSRVPAMIFKAMLETAYSETPKSYGLATETARAVASMGTNLNPWLSMLGDIGWMLAGYNLYDRHYGRPKISSREWNAGGIYRMEGALWYLWREYLPWNALKWDPENPNMLYDLIGTTLGWGTLVRKSDAGEREATRESKAIQTRHRARQKVSIFPTRK